MIRTSAVTVLAVAGLAVTGVIGASAASASPAVPAFQFTTRLDAVMVKPDQVAEITGADVMSVVGSATELADTSDGLDPAECISAFEPGQRAAYEGSGWVDVNTKVLADGGPGRATHFANQTIVVFDDAEASRAYIATASDSWSRCAGQTVTFARDSGQVDEWVLGEAELRPNDVMVMSQTAGSATCERAITGYDEFVLDAMTCDFRGGDPAGQAEQIAAALSAQAAVVDHQR